MNDTQRKLCIAKINGKIEIIEKLSKTNKSIKDFMKEELKNINDENEKLKKGIENVNKG